MPVHELLTLVTSPAGGALLESAARACQAIRCDHEQEANREAVLLCGELVPLGCILRLVTGGANSDKQEETLPVRSP